MNNDQLQLDAGGFVSSKAKVDASATETVVARTYRHAALGERPVIRLTSDRLGEAEDLAMEFLGFDTPQISTPVAIQQRRSLGFAAWALVNDPDNARYALDLVKRMKAADRKAKSKPGHAWDAFTELAKELGRSVRHFLPPFWEEVGRTYKELGNQTYAGRALNKSLEAERVHALESDRARRRDAILEFVLAGCLAGKALSDYAADLRDQYPPAEAFEIFRDLCVRRTRGGMSPWAAMPKDFTKMAKNAGIDADEAYEAWLEEVIETPAMGRAAIQFWKNSKKHCQRIVSRNPSFAVALLRHTRPEPSYDGDKSVAAWLELLSDWGVDEYLWEDELNGAPPLGEPIATWFGRLLRIRSPHRTSMFDMFERLLPRLKRENTPIQLYDGSSYYSGDIDIDMLEACLTNGLTVDDPQEDTPLTFDGWLEEPEHHLRNQDIVSSWDDDRFRPIIERSIGQAITCRGGETRRKSVMRRPFPEAANDRPGITKIWHEYTKRILSELEGSGLVSFENATSRLRASLWPDTLRLFPDIKDRLSKIDAIDALRKTLQSGILDEYGFPALEDLAEQTQVEIVKQRREVNVHLTFPHLAIVDKVHAHVLISGNKTAKHELRIPKDSDLSGLIILGDELLVKYRDDRWNSYFHYASDPSTMYEASYWRIDDPLVTKIDDRRFFVGGPAFGPGDKQSPSPETYVHDGSRFWRVVYDLDRTSGSNFKLQEVDPQNGKLGRDSVPAWFELHEDGEIDVTESQLFFNSAVNDDSPLGAKQGLIGWKVINKRDGSIVGEGIDGRRWEKPLVSDSDSGSATPAALLQQPGTEEYLPITANHRSYDIWDPTGKTIVSTVRQYSDKFAAGQTVVLPLLFWHFLSLRHKPSSNQLRKISKKQATVLLEAAGKDRPKGSYKSRQKNDDDKPTPDNTLAAARDFLPNAPDRLLRGVADITMRADHAMRIFEDLLKQVAKPKSVAKSAEVDTAFSMWNLEHYYSYRDEQKASTSEHLSACVDFLKGNSDGGELPMTEYNWLPLLHNLGDRAWMTYWKAVADRMSKDPSEKPWLEVLEFWNKLGLAELPGKFTTMECWPKGTKWDDDHDVTSGSAFTLVEGEDRFIFIETNEYNEAPYKVLRYSTSKSPEKPKEFSSRATKQLKSKHDLQDLNSFIALARNKDILPLPTQGELQEIADSVTASPIEIGLIWMHGVRINAYENNFLPADLRNMLGWKVTEANAARQALKNMNDTLLAQLYASVTSKGLAAPFSDDRSSVIAALTKTWQSKMPKRLPLEPALQKRLSALCKEGYWQGVDQEDLLEAAASPQDHSILAVRDFHIASDNDKYYPRLELQPKKKGDEELPVRFIKGVAKLIAMIHSETPAGHAARAEVPALGKQLSKLIDSPKTAIYLRTIWVHETKKKKISADEWLNQYLGKTKNSAREQISRYDDGLVLAAALDKGESDEVLIAFRPGKLMDAADLERIKGIASIDLDDHSNSEPINALTVASLKSTGFDKLCKSKPNRKATEDDWLQDPRATAPEIVSAVQDAQKLDEDSATLYLQLLALPDPTTANLRKWNNWTAAKIKKAAAVLLKKKLLLEAKRSRAGRSHFLPGEWLELKAPWLPIETWKLAHLTESVFDLGGTMPLGGPMVLRPFDELFAAAWQRIVDGDKPKYEKATRKSSRSKATKKKTQKK